MCAETEGADSKIIDLIQKKEEGAKPFVSIEFFPPRSETGVKVSLGSSTLHCFRVHPMSDFVSLSCPYDILVCPFYFNLY